MSTKTRNRVIYQSEALYVGQPSATGVHINAVIDTSDDSTDTLSDRIFGLIKDPENINDICILDWKDYWTPITAPIDLIDGTGAYVSPYKGPFVSGTPYGKDDVVHVELSAGEKLYFEAAQAVPDEVDGVGIKAGEKFTPEPAATLKTFTDNGARSFATKDFDTLSVPGWDIAPAIRQLNRVQNANYSFSFNRQDVNQFGQLHRIDSVAIDPPTVSLDFSYYINNGANEKLIGFNINDYASLVDKSGGNFINMKEQEDDFEGKNFFILTSPQGEDSVKNDAWDTDGNYSDDTGHSVIALGNGYVTNYSVEASVGAMPTASVTVEGLNLKSDSGFHNKSIPAVDNGRGTPIEGTKFTLPAPVSGVLDDGQADSVLGDANPLTGEADGFSCLRPGDIEMHLGTDGRAGLMNTLPSSTPPTDHTDLGCHVQSFSIELPMSRTPLQRLGTPYAYTRPIDLPLTVNINVTAIVADLKSGNVADHLFNYENHDLHFILREPQVDGRGPIAMAFFARGAQLESESFSSSIGDNKSVDLTFTCQVGGEEDNTRGLMIAGSRGAIPTDRTWPAAGTYDLIKRFDPAER